MTGNNAKMFLESIHGGFDCQLCHLGPEDGTFDDMAGAHVGVEADPSAIGKCDGCHFREAAATANSLHTNLWGEKAAIEARSGIAMEGSPHEGHFDQKCGSCHTTCGQCHVSRPNSVGGGFPKIGTYYSHRFRKTPDMTEQCTACHGSRVGIDYTGDIEGNVPDVHRSAGYTCEFCHSKEEIHGDGQHRGEHYNHRYEVATMPRCEDCHTPTVNAYHGAHLDTGSRDLQCQVCHSQPYKNCTNCHLKDGGYDINPSQIQFKIARNPSPYRTEYDYAVVRHTPIDPLTYESWGLALPNYLDKPTWQYASPHSILRWTPQTTVTGACFASCHDTGAQVNGYFLRESDLYADDGVTKLVDYDANIGIVIED